MTASNCRYLKDDESVASPTCSLEGMFTTAVIASYKRHKVASFDVPGAFLQALLPDNKNVIMKLCNKFADIMIQVNPEYEKFVVIENGKTNSSPLCSLYHL